MPTTTVKHVVPRLLDESGNQTVICNVNTFDDVVLSDTDVTENVGAHVHYYVVCDTAADVAAKEVTVGNGTSTNLVKKGANFIVTFTNGNTAASPTMSVNGGTAYPLTEVTESSVSVGQTVSLLFTGTGFITAAGSGGTKIEEDPISGDEGEEAATKYVAMVGGSSDNSSISYDPEYYVDGDGMHGEAGATTATFEDEAATANTDYRSSSPLTSGDTLGTLFKKVKKILAGLGSLAFKSSVGTTELDATLSTAYSNRLSKSDLYNGTDYSGSAGAKALDATVGATLQNSITSLNSKITSFENTKSTIVASNLGKALGMATTNTWAQVVEKISGVANRGAFSKTFTPTTSSQSASGSAGYYTSVTTKCNAVSLTGNAGVGNVLTGKTFYTTSLTKQTGTMANRGALNWTPTGSTTYSVPAGYYSGGTLNSSGAYNAGVTAADNRVNTNSRNYKSGYNAGYSAGQSNGRTLKTATYNATSEASTSRPNDNTGSPHNIWRVPIRAITTAHRIVGAYYYETTGNKYDFVMAPNGYIMCDSASYIIPMRNISGNTSDWATKTSGTIYLSAEHASRKCAITLYYV